MKKRIEELRAEGNRMVNVKNDLWYNIVDYSLDINGFIVRVKADNNVWYSVKEVQELR